MREAGAKLYTKVCRTAGSKICWNHWRGNQRRKPRQRGCQDAQTRSNRADTGRDGCINVSIRRFVLSALLGLVMIEATAKRPAFASDLQSSLDAAAHSFEDAQFRKDVTLLKHLIAPNFLFVPGSGQLSRREDFVEQFADSRLRFDRFSITDRTTLRLQGGDAIVTGLALVQGVTYGKAFSRRFRYADTYEYQDGQWLVIFSQVTPTKQ